MPNPFLPLWEYIPDGEPRVFGGRVYLYGSHDSASQDSFCDKKLKVWSAPLDNLNSWVCHGDCFHTKDDFDHKSDTPWTENDLYAPDVVERGGKYYLYAFIAGAKGCVAVSDTPTGPFKLLSTYKYNIPEGKSDDFCENGSFVDPGVLVDKEKTYIFCGFQQSYGAEIDSSDMCSIIDGSYVEDVIPKEEPFSFYEASSPRKIGDTYYLIYSKRPGSKLVYATSKSPLGPYTYGGVIIDNAKDYPDGNNHGSICNINGQWYVFYHRMTNGTIMSRRACVEKIRINPDGSIDEVEMTSLGFEDSLNPYCETSADIACVLIGSAFVTERNVFSRPVVNIKDGDVIGYKYFDFGQDFSSKTMDFCAKIRGSGSLAKVKILLDSPDNGEEIGELDIGPDDTFITSKVKAVQGRHSVYFKVRHNYGGFFLNMFEGRELFQLESFFFSK